MSGIDQIIRFGYIPERPARSPDGKATLAGYTRRMAALPQPSFDTVALPHLDAAYNLAYWLMRDRAEAEDVVQDAFVRALRYFSSFQGGDPRAWLLSIVRNAAYSRLAARRATVPLDDEDGEAPLAEVLRDPGDDPETALARRQDRERLDALLGALPVELRECVVLCDLEGMSYKEIAQVTGTPIGTVMSRLWRARQTLMKLAKEGR
jgi:RNA polymerase sigma-70 factor, ECF subfamily